MRRVRLADGCAHFSQLKQMARSPLHYLAAVEKADAFVPTAEMRVGTTAHRIILGARVGHEIVLWDGERRGNAWKAFKAEHPRVEIVTAAEAIRAQAIADAALENELVRDLVERADAEVPLRWTDGGIECATGGLDLLGADYLADLKTTSSTEPRRWQAHALAMSYHAQLAFYDAGARANGHDPQRHLLIGIEAAAPHAVTVLELTPALLELGHRAVVLWLERLRSCEENDAWPGYVEEAIAFDVPPWMTDAAGDDDGDSGLIDEEFAA